MNFNKVGSAIILSLGMAAFGAQADSVQGGRVTFTGSIVDAACSINPQSENLDVPLGSIGSAQLLNSGKSTPQPFQIVLENCAVTSGIESASSRAATANSVSITFNGIADESNSSLLSLSGATGAGVAITNAGGQLLELGKESSLYSLTDGKNILDFSAYLQGNNKPVETGEFSAIANFTLNYL